MNGIKAYAFDVYGTLIDTNGVLEKLQLYVGEQASSISATWRAKQLEYSFRRGLMEQYVPFPVVTAQAFHYALAAHQIALNDEAIAAIIGSYAHLPAFPDAKAALEKLA
ncbi:MAG: HAD-IA family hydrolase, partial [Bacteroidota bacterium]